VKLSIDGLSVPLSLPSASDPPPLTAMVPIVEALSGASAGLAKYKASAQISGAQAQAAAGVYNGLIQALNAVVIAICAPLAAAGDSTAAQIMQISAKMAAAAAEHQAQVAATAAQLG
jgi:hypothetical protein